MAKILVVDNSRPSEFFLTGSSVVNGYEVILAENGQEALELLEREHPKAVVLDLKMPGMDGIALLKDIRLVDRKVPVIVLMGTRIGEMEQQLYASGVTEFLEKEFALYRLVDSLQRHLRVAGAPT